jgi:spoIIIJ-associated protein
MDESILYAKRYIEDLLSFFGLNIDVYATHDDEVIELQIPSTHLNGFLIGQRGDTMRAMQFLISSALKNAGYEYYRVSVDVAEYKKARQERLEEQTRAWIAQVKKTHEAMELRPMGAAERRIVHKLAGDEGLETESVGEGRDRRVVIMPSDGLKTDSDEIDEPEEPKDTESAPADTDADTGSDESAEKTEA